MEQFRPDVLCSSTGDWFWLELESLLPPSLSYGCLLPVSETLLPGPANARLVFVCRFLFRNCFVKVCLVDNVYLFRFCYKWRGNRAAIVLDSHMIYTCIYIYKLCEDLSAVHSVTWYLLSCVYIEAKEESSENCWVWNQPVWWLRRVNRDILDTVKSVFFVPFILRISRPWQLHKNKGANYYFCEGALFAK